MITKAETLKECFHLLDAEYGDKLTDTQRTFKKELFKKLIGVYPPDAIRKMTIKLLKTHKYNTFPKVAEMVELIEGNKELEAEEAWIYLKEKVRDVGYYKSVRFEKYPAIGNFIESYGGWTKFCEELTDKEEKWIKKEFIKIYPIAKEKGCYPESFPGFHALNNTAKGYDNEGMINRLGRTIDGDKVKRKQVEGSVAYEK